MPTDAEALAYEVLEWAALPEITEKAKAAVEAGNHKWVFDPDVDGVVGLISTGAQEQKQGEAEYRFNRYGVLHGNGPTAHIIVYIEAGDFECDEEWLYANQ